MDPKRIRRPVAAVDTSNQMALFAAAAGSPPIPAPAPASGAPVFRQPDPRELRLNGMPLDQHLEMMGVRAPLRVRALLERMDWRAFAADYSAKGRPAYAPAAMLGLILYGMMQGVSSLRGLERFACADLGALWVTGGVFPDHAVIGRFIVRHAERLGNEGFAELTAQVLRAVGGGRGDGAVAGDGTVIEAAASRFQTVRAEALAARAERGRERHAEAPSERTARRLAEHEAAGQALRPMLDQARRLLPVKTLLLDAGYFCSRVLALAAGRGIELLAPHDRGPGLPPATASGQRFPKSRFAYLPAEDAYRCPAGRLLWPAARRAGARPPPWTLYRGGAQCADCPQRASCTSARQGRSIKRFPGDAAKDALRARMQEPEAQRRYRSRQAMVEPVFSRLRGQQGLNRFRRKGLAGVRVEFALHAMAYNLSRLAAACAALLRLCRQRLAARILARALDALIPGMRPATRHTMAPCLSGRGSRG